jgi:hypothetical protein
MPETLATILTTTTYGTWLRGDARNWVEDGIIYPPSSTSPAPPPTTPNTSFNKSLPLSLPELCPGPNPQME